jgi:anthranilate synthase/aminodeoxychorismate synthase-like glutamine amidotransferase
VPEPESEQAVGPEDAVRPVSLPPRLRPARVEPAALRGRRLPWIEPLDAAPPAARTTRRPDVLLVDNYDSFVHNLARYLRELGARTRVVRNDGVAVDAILRERPTHVVLSPGPKTPREAGISNEVVEALGRDTPILGVCLGHQCIGAVYGGVVGRARRAMHGKASLVFHEGRGILRGIPSPFLAARYHSLVVDPGTVPEELEVIATTADGEVMAVAHRVHPVTGVQFHPESVLTEHGYRILANFLETSGPAG